MSTWRVGETATLTNGSKIVTGTATTWLSAAPVVYPGYELVDDTGARYEIASISSDTSLDLVENYGGVNGAKTISIVPISRAGMEATINRFLQALLTVKDLGQTIRSGIAAPLGATGNDGDFYVDTVALDWYGPKAAGAWPAGVGLVGAGAQLLDAKGKLLSFSTEVVALAVGTTGQLLSADPAEATGLKWIDAPVTGRETLSAARDYYLRPGGSDANTGLGNTDGEAFATVQKWFNVVNNLDGNGFACTLNIADGTYSAPRIDVSVGLGFDENTLRIIGNTTTPANVVLELSTGNFQGVISFSAKEHLRIRGVTLQSNVAATNSRAITMFGPGSRCRIDNCRIGANLRDPFVVTGASELRIDGPMEWLANLSGNMFSVEFGGNIRMQSITWTITGTPSCGNFIFASSTGSVLSQSVTYTGAAIGRRFLTDAAGGVQTYTGAPDANLPGNVAGIATAPGWAN